MSPMYNYLGFPSSVTSRLNSSGATENGSTSGQDSPCAITERQSISLPISSTQFKDNQDNIQSPFPIIYSRPSIIRSSPDLSVKFPSTAGSATRSRHPCKKSVQFHQIYTHQNFESNYEDFKNTKIYVDNGMHSFPESSEFPSFLNLNDRTKELDELQHTGTISDSFKLNNTAFFPGSHTHTILDAFYLTPERQNTNIVPNQYLGHDKKKAHPIELIEKDTVKKDGLLSSHRATCRNNYDPNDLPFQINNSYSFIHQSIPDPPLWPEYMPPLFTSNEPLMSSHLSPAPFKDTLHKNSLTVSCVPPGFETRDYFSKQPEFIPLPPPPPPLFHQKQPTTMQKRAVFNNELSLCSTTMLKQLNECHYFEPMLQQNLEQFEKLTNDNLSLNSRRSKNHYTTDVSNNILLSNISFQNNFLLLNEQHTPYEQFWNAYHDKGHDHQQTSPLNSEVFSDMRHMCDLYTNTDKPIQCILSNLEKKSDQPFLEESNIKPLVSNTSSNLIPSSDITRIKNGTLIGQKIQHIVLPSVQTTSGPENHHVNDRLIQNRFILKENTLPNPLLSHSSQIEDKPELEQTYPLGSPFKQPVHSSYSNELLDMDEEHRFILHLAILTLYKDQIKPFQIEIRHRLQELHCSPTLERNFLLLYEAFDGLYIIERAGDNTAVYLRETPSWFSGWVDMRDTHNPYPIRVWMAFELYIVQILRAPLNNNFLLPHTDIETTPDESLLLETRGGRYGMSKRLKTSGPSIFKQYSLGQVCHIVQLAVHLGILAYEGGSLVPAASCRSVVRKLYPPVSEATCPPNIVSSSNPIIMDRQQKQLKDKRLVLVSSEVEQDEDTEGTNNTWPVMLDLEEVQRNLEILLNADDFKPMLLSQLKFRFLHRFKRRFDPVVFGFARLSDFLAERCSHCCRLVREGGRQVLVDRVHTFSSVMDNNNQGLPMSSPKQTEHCQSAQWTEEAGDRLTKGLLAVISKHQRFHYNLTYSFWQFYMDSKFQRNMVPLLSTTSNIMEKPIQTNDDSIILGYSARFTDFLFSSVLRPASTEPLLSCSQINLPNQTLNESSMLPHISYSQMSCLRWFTRKPLIERQLGQGQPLNEEDCKVLQEFFFAVLPPRLPLLSFPFETSKGSRPSKLRRQITSQITQLRKDIFSSPHIETNEFFLGSSPKQK